MVNRESATPGRSAERTEAILRATLDLVRESGYRALSVEGIAARAGVGKHTIYRRWRSKGLIFLDAFSSQLEPNIRHRDTGDIVADLRHQLHAAFDVVAKPPFGELFAALAGEAQHDPAVAASLHEGFLGPQWRDTAERIESAQRQGHLAPDIDPHLAVSMIYGPLWHILLFRPEPLTLRDVDAVLDAAIRGLKP